MVGFGALFERLSLDIYLTTLLNIMSGIMLYGWWVPNTQPIHREPCEGEDNSFARSRQPGTLASCLCVHLIQLSHGSYHALLTLHLESLGYSRALVGLLWVLETVAEAILFLTVSRLL